jgi:hypothetical protein
MDVWSILRPFGIWYILWSFGKFLCRFGILHQVKSGNPEPNGKKVFVVVLRLGMYTCRKDAFVEIVFN